MANVLETLSKDEHNLVRQAVARNRNTPVTVLETLSKNKDVEVKHAASCTGDAC